MCSGEACPRKGEGPITNVSRWLCPHCNEARLRVNRKPRKLPKRVYKKWDNPEKSRKKYQRIKLKPWKENPRKVLDNAFSKFILQKFPPVCYTCPQIRNLECGHFQSRRNDATRWLISNCRPQCKNCNQYNHGKQKLFRENLVAEIGESAVLEIEQLSKTTVHFSKSEILELTVMYLSHMKVM